MRSSLLLRTDVHALFSLVGGSTRIPKVQQLLEEFFDGKVCLSLAQPILDSCYSSISNAETYEGNQPRRSCRARGGRPGRDPYWRAEVWASGPHGRHPSDLGCVFSILSNQKLTDRAASGIETTGGVFTKISESPSPATALGSQPD